MCEYCGCEALPLIGELSREHDLVLSLVCEVRVARDEGDGPRMAELASRIAALLGPHTEVEERGLFPALAADFPDQIAILEAEHQQVAAVLVEASSGPPEDPAWPDRLAAALALLRAHFRRGQDGVLPAALASLHTADWEAMRKSAPGSPACCPARRRPSGLRQAPGWMMAQLLSGRCPGPAARCCGLVMVWTRTERLQVTSTVPRASCIPNWP